MDTGQSVFNAILNDGHRKNVIFQWNKEKLFGTSLKQHIQHFSAINHSGEAVNAERTLGC